MATRRTDRRVARRHLSVDGHADPHDVYAFRTEVMERLSGSDRQVGELTKGLAQTQEAVRGLNDTLHGFVEEVRSQFRQNNKPTQWGVLIALMGLVLGAAGSFTTLVTSPLSRNQEIITERIQSLENTDATVAKFMGGSETWRMLAMREMDALTAHVQQFEDESLKNADNRGYVRGQLDAIKNQLNAVDFNGSRKWIGESRAP